MTDSTNRPDPADAPPATPTQRQLDRVPGERYRARPAAAATAGAATSAAPQAPDAATGSPTRAVLAGLLAATGGAIGYAVLGQVDLGPGLLAVAAFVGWAVGIGVVWGSGSARPIARSRSIAAILGAAAVIVGLLLAWAWSRVEGGVLGPLEYTDARYGLLAWVEVVLAAGVAAARGR